MEYLVRMFCSQKRMKSTHFQKSMDDSWEKRIHFLISRFYCRVCSNKGPIVQHYNQDANRCICYLQIRKIHSMTLESTKQVCFASTIQSIPHSCTALDLSFNQQHPPPVWAGVLPQELKSSRRLKPMRVPAVVGSPITNAQMSNPRYPIAVEIKHQINLQAVQSKNASCNKK